MSDQIQTINPVNGEEIATYDYMSDTEMNDAVAACHEAFNDWKARPSKDRAQIIRAIGEELENCKEDEEREIPGGKGLSPRWNASAG